MACLFPITAWYSKDVNPTGKRSLVFKKELGDLRLESVKVPCGKCAKCRIDRAQQWAIRCVHEAKMHSENVFVTLTYNDKWMVKRCGVYDEQSDSISEYSLNKLDFVNFMKRLRKWNASGRPPRTCTVPLEGQIELELSSSVRGGSRGGERCEYPPVRFYHCGEYGSKYGRPHHHVCIFGLDFPDKRLWQDRGGTKLFVSETLESLWSDPKTGENYGFCSIGEVTKDSAAYVAKYVQKKITGDLAEKYYDGIQSEYSTMSRRPGIGNKFIRRFTSDVFGKDRVVIDEGLKLRPPKYYDSIYDKIDPIRMALLKGRRKAEAKRMERPQTVERAANRAEFYSLKMRQQKRNYEKE